MDVAFYMTTKALITIERDISDPQLLNAFLKAHGKKKQNHHEVLVPFKQIEAFKFSLDIAIAYVQKKVKNGEQANWATTFHHLRRIRGGISQAITEASELDREEKAAEKKAHKKAILDKAHHDEPAPLFAPEEAKEVKKAHKIINKDSSLFAEPAQAQEPSPDELAEMKALLFAKTRVINRDEVDIQDLLSEEMTDPEPLPKDCSEGQENDSPKIDTPEDEIDISLFADPTVALSMTPTEREAMKALLFAQTQVIDRESIDLEEVLPEEGPSTPRPPDSSSSPSENDQNHETAISKESSPSDEEKSSLFAEPQDGKKSKTGSLFADE